MFLQEFIFLGQGCYDGVLSWFLLGSWEFLFRTRGCLKIEDSSLLQVLDVNGGVCGSIYFRLLTFDLNSFDVLL